MVTRGKINSPNDLIAHQIFLKYKFINQINLRNSINELTENQNKI